MRHLLARQMRGKDLRIGCIGIVAAGRAVRARVSSAADRPVPVVRVQAADGPRALPVRQLLLPGEHDLVVLNRDSHDFPR